MNKEEAIEKDKQNKAIKFYKSFIEGQEQELYWMEKEDEEYYKYEIEEKELLIKGFKTILNLIEKQKSELEKKDKIIDLMIEEELHIPENELYKVEKIYREIKDKTELKGRELKRYCIKEYFEKKVGE